jgi:hypothetical protein
MLDYPDIGNLSMISSINEFNNQASRARLRRLMQAGEVYSFPMLAADFATGA